MNTGMILWIGTLAAIALAIWLPCDSVSVQQGRALPQVVLWLLLAFVFASVRLFAKPLSNSASPARWPTGLWIGGALLGWVLLSVLSVRGHGNLQLAINVGWQWCAMAACLWLLTHQLDLFSNRKTLILLLVGLSFSAAWHAGHQYTISMPQDRARYQSDPEGMLRESDFVAPPGSTARMQYENRLMSTEPTGPFSLANSLAGLLVSGTMLTFAIVVHARNWRTPRGWFWLVTLLIQVGILGLTKSRAGWIGLAVAGFLYLWSLPEARIWFGRHRVRIAASTLGLVTVTILGLLLMDPLLLWEAPKSFAFRWQYWRSTVALIGEHFWLGVGPGNFQAYYPTYKLVEASETIADPHSFYLEVAATSGIPAMLLLGFGFVVLLWGVGYRPELWNESGLNGEPTEGKEVGTPSPLLVGSIAIVVSALLVWLVPGLIGMSPELLPYLVAIPWMIGLIATSEFDRLPRSIYVCCLIGTLVHLTGSGGWMTPGNMIPILILVSLIASEWRPLDMKWMAVTVPKWVHTSMPIGVLGIGLLVFITTAWRPYYAIMDWQFESKRPMQMERSLLLAEQAALAAPWNPEPLQMVVQLNQLEVAEKLAKGNPASGSLESLHRSLARWIERNPQDWSIRMSAGEALLGLTPLEPKELPLAIEHFEAAVRLHPTEAWLWVQAAVGHWLQGNLEKAADMVKEAERLDGLNPHWDHKIGMARILWPTFGPKSGVSPEKRDRPASDPASPPDYCEGEPALRTLRRLLQIEDRPSRAG